MTQKERERQEAIEALRKIVKPGQTVYCGLKHCSRSGMQREIALYVVEDGEIRWITGYAARAIGNRIGKRDGIIIGGCGMDMGFALVYELSHALYPTYTCLGPRKDGQRMCPSNYHRNPIEGRERFDLEHKDGYALRSQWI